MKKKSKPPHFPPGSIALFAGRHWMSRIIAMRTCSFYELLVARRWFSHVGIVFNYEGKQYIGDSTTMCDVPCAISKRQIAGVQAHPLEEKCESYPGKVWILPLADNRRLKPKQSELLTDMVVNDCGNVFYDKHGALIAGTRWLKYRSWHYEDLRTKFCSEFVRGLYEDLRLLPDENASNVTPYDLYEEVRRKGVCGPPVRVK